MRLEECVAGRNSSLDGGPYRAVHVLLVKVDVAGDEHVLVVGERRL